MREVVMLETWEWLTLRSKDPISGFPRLGGGTLRASALGVHLLGVPQLATTLALRNRSPFLLDFIQRSLGMSA
jgi:hypothetical protein